jgi:hypothetical protein
MVPEIMIWAAKHKAMMVKVTHGSLRTVLLSCPMGIIIFLPYLNQRIQSIKESPK